MLRLPNAWSRHVLAAAGIVAPLVLAAGGPRANAAERLTPLVDPFIGTGGHGHTHPAATLPFGMVQVGPDTRLGGWDGSSGYHFSDTRILGFTHTHLSGTGIPDYGDVLLMPMTGEPRTNNGADSRPGYSSAFSHSRETATPGYYGVTLDDSGIRAEMTATLRTGLHRYYFPADREAHVVLDLEHRDTVIEALARLDGDTQVEGLRRSRNWARDQRVFFAIRFSRPFVQARLVEGDGPAANDTEARGTRVKVLFSFGRLTGPLLIKVGLSAVGLAGARANLDAESPGWDFDAARRAADETWEHELAKIRVRGGTPAQRRIFYTALYHALLTPNVFMDADGSYLGRDGQVHRAQGFTYYSVFSLWDTFRALHPLLTIIDRARTRDVVRTFLQQFEQGGRLPVWELWGNETDTMIGYHAVPVIADAWLKGIEEFDQALAWRALVHSADEDRAGLASYKASGFVAAEAEPESVSRTLEYAYDDWTIAMVARRLGRQEDHERFLRRAQAWKHLFEPSTGFVRARQDGFWFAPFDPAEVNIHYTEANAWQYSFYVPHDVDGLMRAHGGAEAFAARLDALFSADSRTTGREQADITGLVGQYAHGNEPSHHMAYLYAFAGRAWQTQAMVRRLMDTMYGPGPHGLAGNEDCGQMSAWFVFSALGFYPVTPGSGDYVIGTPLFPEATIALENGRAFTIAAGDVSARNLYVQGATLDGQPWTRAVLPHDRLMAGGELRFSMGPHPNRAWGTAPPDRPRTAIDDHLITPAPFATEGRPVFRGTTPLALDTLERGATIRYTLDGTPPTGASSLYEGPLRIDDTTMVRAAAFTEGRPPSPPVTFRLHRAPDNVRVTVSAPWAPQYNGGGEDALVDGRRGGPDFRLGQWQGYRVASLEAVVDLGAPREIRRVSMGFLEEREAWVLLPREIQVSVSLDGQAWTDAGTARPATREGEGPMRQDLAVSLADNAARFVRIQVTGAGALPAGHVGAGEMSWIFADEIVIE